MQPVPKKLKSILLVDDDDVTLFYNSHMINKLGVSEHIHSELSGADALKYLVGKDRHTSDYVKPDLIFLDINMPVMNGFEFLEAYEELPAEDKGAHTIVMLTSSLLDQDRNRASSFSSVSAYYPKPLRAEMIQEIVDRFFGEYN